ncbi:YHS domain-containing (seleno)protein [Mucilaginibacter terrae]|uniref:YHS domain-containing (seleno)protein n=1 Tax=Mucilaginibacter terrae TaxID=1955052 RepID=UPI0036286DA2
MYKYLFFLLFMVGTLTNVQAQKQFNLDGSGLALAGYDPVAYFTQQKAVEGRKEIALLNQDVTYHFASTQNRDLFKANPAKYQPQYGGWCAYAMGANGTKVAVDPETFKLVNGKLYLFYNKFFNNTKKSWDKDESNLKTKADANWTKFNQN